MKKIMLFLLLISLIISTNVYAATNPYKQTNKYGKNCTYLAWKYAYEKGGVILPGWGNAKDWLKDAKNSGYEVGNTPRNNSIVVYGDWTDYGHVSYVERVDNTNLYVWGDYTCYDETPEIKQCLEEAQEGYEQSQCYIKYNAKKVACSTPINSDLPYMKISGYIYLDTAPKKTTTTKKKTTKETTTKTKTTTTTQNEEELNQTNYAYLKDLIINEISFDFNENIFEYNLEVTPEINKISINALPYENAIVDSNLEYDLVDGINIIDIVVTDTLENQNVYKLNINKKVIAKKVAKKQTDNYIIYIGICVFILVIVILIIIVKKKKEIVLEYL